MEKKSITRIIDFVKETDLAEFSLVKEDSKICFKRQPDSVKASNKGDNASARTEAAGEQVVKEEVPIRVAIKSLMVGTFHTSVSEDRPPFVVVGGKVVPGQKVGVIEAMKVMKDVISTIEGKISKRLVENGSHVEYGQELFLVEPDK